MTNDLPCLPCPMTSDDFNAARKNGKRLACERMYDEMAELRELVRDLYRCVANIGNYDAFYYAPSEPGCGIDCVVNGDGCCLRTFERRVRDLGVEADG